MNGLKIHVVSELNKPVGTAKLGRCYVARLRIRIRGIRRRVEDLEEMQASDSPKAFFYFTKESHIYTLLNCILEGGIKTKVERNAIPELDYLSQIVFELYESENATVDDEPNTFNYSIRITLSPGCHTFAPLDV